MPLPHLRTRFALSAALLACLIGAGGLVPAPAEASHTQLSMIMDDSALIGHPAQAFQQFRLLGVQVIRVSMWWNHVAPARRPHGFNPSDPKSHGYIWAYYDSVVEAAAQNGIAIDLDVMGGAPSWAEGRGAPGPGHSNWEPNAGQYGQFVHAVATRYSGTFIPPGGTTPLPRVRFWSIWNEPDYGPSLAPQGVPGHLTIDFAPLQYRNLLDAAWSSLMATHHTPNTDTIIFGEVAH